MSRFDPARLPKTTPEIERFDGRRAGRLRCSMLGSNQGEVLDLSATGARVLLRRHPDLKAGDTFTLDIETNAGAVHTPCTCVWIRLNSERKFEMGVEFNNLDPDAKRRLLETVLHPTRSETLRRGWNFVPEPMNDDEHDGNTPPTETPADK